MSYCQNCVPANGYKKKLYKMIGPDMQAWMQDNRIAYTRIPLHNPACEKIFKEGAPLITSPANGTEYLISRKHPEPLQLVCRQPVTPICCTGISTINFTNHAVLERSNFLYRMKGR